MAFRLPQTKGMVRRDAASWLARLQSGRDPDVEQKFQRWRDADPRHAEAFARVHRSYNRAGLLRYSADVASAKPERSSPKPRWAPRPALAAAAAAIVLVPVGVLLVRGTGAPFAGTEAVMLMTNVGEIKQVDLADGSKVTLDTATKVEVEIGRSVRSAHLKYGRARFQVARASTPFVVQSPSATISTRQGVIDVEQIAQQGRVQVLAGAADVSGAGEAARVRLDAGEAVVNLGGGEQKGVALRGPDWTRGMLQFDGTPLDDAVALANRYSKHHIILAGDLDALRVTGAFRAGDTTGLAKALAAAFSLSLEQRADGELVLSRSMVSDSRKKKGG